MSFDEARAVWEDYLRLSLLQDTLPEPSKLMLGRGGPDMCTPCKSTEPAPRAEEALAQAAAGLGTGGLLIAEAGWPSVIEEGFPVSSVASLTRKKQEAAPLAKVVPTVAWEEVMGVRLHRETHVMGVFHDLPCRHGSVGICSWT